MILYKVLHEDGRPFHGGIGTWPLPRDGKPGAWLAVEGTLAPCQRGLHACRRDQLVAWLGPTIYELEPGSDVLDWNDKVGMRRARLVRRVETWTERAARLFASDCAEHVLDIFEQCYPDDQRPRRAIEVARRYANGQASHSDLQSARAAAAAAAGAAERAAAGAAAWAAARAARAAEWAAAGVPAWEAATAAAGAAWDAAWAAWDAERKWQTERLFAYLAPKRTAVRRPA